MPTDRREEVINVHSLNRVARCFPRQKRWGVIVHASPNYISTTHTDSPVILYMLSDLDEEETGVSHRTKVRST